MRSQILENIMVIWFNGFQTNGTLCNKEINRSSLHYTSTSHGRKEGRMPCLAVFPSSKRIDDIQKKKEMRSRTNKYVRKEQMTSSENYVVRIEEEPGIFS
jgi:hypothetical protein